MNPDVTPNTIPSPTFVCQSISQLLPVSTVQTLCLSNVGNFNPSDSLKLALGEFESVCHLIVCGYPAEIFGLLMAEEDMMTGSSGYQCTEESDNADFSRDDLGPDDAEEHGHFIYRSASAPSGTLAA